jgi:hypothetical protein
MPPRAWHALATILVLLCGALAVGVSAPGAEAAPARAPAPPSDIGTLEGVSCGHGAGCFAVGWDNSGARAESWTGSSWDARPVAAGGQLSGVSCGGPRSCISVGFDSGVAAANLWNGAYWQPLGVPQPPGATSTWLNAVSCSGLRTCVAVGQFSANDDVTTAATAELWNGGRWSMLWVPAPADSLFSALDAVSCSNPSSCMAIGSYHTGNYVALTLAEYWNGSYWSIRSTPSPPGATAAGLSGVSCIAPNGCLAVGSFGTSGELWHALSEVWNGYRWAISYPVDPAGATFTQLTSVACTSGTSCVAVGYDTSPLLVTAPLAEWDVRGRWRQEPTPPARSSAVLDGVSCAGARSCSAVGSEGGELVADDWDGASWQPELTSPIAAVVATPQGGGYYLVTADGTVYPFGDARFYGDLAGEAISAPVVGMAIDQRTGGYWLVGSDGGIYAFHAPFLGSTGGEVLAAPIVAMESAPSGNGYRLVAADGGVFVFGHGVRYLGSMGGVRLTDPIVGAAADLETGGYWLVAADGGVFSFGAPFLGSLGGLGLTRPIVGMEAESSGRGYRMVASDGGVFNFGAAQYAGSLGGRPLYSPIVGMAPTPSGTGYWLVHEDGDVNAFGDAPSLGSI